MKAITSRALPVALTLLAACGGGAALTTGSADGAIPATAEADTATVEADTAAGDAAAAADANADRLLSYLEGTFDSADQAEANPDYFAVSLVSCVVDAPELGARALYVEQALMSSPDAPYRQRIYTIEAADAVRASTRIYAIVGEEDAVGICAGPRATVRARDVTLREGCGVDVVWDGARYTGGTQGEACASSLRGAAYATSEVELSDDELDSWDRGYNAQGEQVWGATAEPYVFVRRSALRDF